MKTVIIVLISLMSLSAVSFNRSPLNRTNINDLQSVSADENVQELMRYFLLHRQGRNGVSVNWFMNSQVGISSFSVERSYDGEFFDLVSQSSPVSSMRYTVLDQGVYPGYIFYRIACQMESGSVIYSDAKMVRIVQR